MSLENEPSESGAVRGSTCKVGRKNKLPTGSWQTAQGAKRVEKRGREKEKTRGGRQGLTRGENQRRVVRGTGEMKNNGREKGAGRRRDDKEAGVRQQKLKIKMNPLAQR